jgi:hypothetical protein
MSRLVGEGCERTSNGVSLDGGALLDGIRFGGRSLF